MSMLIRRSLSPLLDVGTLIDGQYRIARAIEQGGIGSVYEVEHDDLGLRMALRLLYSLDSDPGTRRRFERGAKALARLSHPGIASVTDYGFHDEIPYLVSELVDGISLRDLLDRELLSVDDAVRYTLQILEALAHAHGHGIVHHDLHPSNVWVGGAARDRHLKLVGFAGLEFIEENVDTIVNSDESALGDPAYLAPEQSIGAPSDSRADLYAVGVMLFEMLTGRRPFEGSSSEIVRGHLTGRVPTLGELRAELAGQPAVQAAVSKSLRKVQEERFQSATSFAASLREVIERHRPIRPFGPALPWEDAADELEPDTRLDNPFILTEIEAIDPSATGLQSFDRNAGSLGERPDLPDSDEQTGVESAGAGEEASPSALASLVAVGEPKAQTSAPSLPRAARDRAALDRTVYASSDDGRISQWRPRNAPLVIGVITAAIAAIVVMTDRHDLAQAPVGEVAAKAAEVRVASAPVSTSSTPAEPVIKSHGPEPSAADGAKSVLTPPSDFRRQAAWRMLGKSADDDLTARDLFRLAAFAREHGEDPYPHLIMATAYLRIDSYRHAQTRMEWAYRTDHEIRRDPRMLLSLIDLLVRSETTRRAASLIERAYGAEAIEPLDAELKKQKETSYAASRLRALKRKLEARHR